MFKLTEGIQAIRDKSGEIIQGVTEAGLRRLGVDATIRGKNGVVIDSSAEGGIRTSAISIEQADNSSETPLGAGEEFTGQWVNAAQDGIRVIFVTVNTDQDSATRGLVIEFSKDGVTVDKKFDYTIFSGEPETHSFGVINSFFRVRYINGDTAQNTFRLQTLWHPFNVKPSTHRIDSNISGENDAELVLSVITGKDNNGVFRNARVNNEGALKMVASSGSEIIPTLGTNLKYDDFNASTGGIARGTPVASTDGWVKVYDSTAIDANASGLLIGMLINLEAFNTADPSKRWEVRIVARNEEILFGPNGASSSDLVDPGVYGYQDDPTKAAIEWNGIMVRGSILRWEGPVNLPITYDSNGVQVYVRKQGGTKAFNAGYITLTRG